MSDTEILAAVIAAVQAQPGTVSVLGDGQLASTLRERLGPRLTTGDAAPSAAVDTTGDPLQIARLLAEVDDLGTVILVGPPPDEPPALDLYGDLHVRGLRLIGLTLTDEAG